MSENKEQEQPELNRQFFSNELKLFGKYPYSEEVKDVTLADLMAINTPKSNIIVPHTSGRYQVKRFRKIQCPEIPSKKIQKNSMPNCRKINKFFNVSWKK